MSNLQSTQPAAGTYASTDVASHPMPYNGLAGRPPKTWAEFFERVNQSEPDPEFMASRPLNTVSVDRDIFADDED